MEEFVLDVQERQQCGKSSANAARRQGMIPIVVYARGEDAVSGTVEYHQFERLARKARTSQVFTFRSGDATLDGTRAIVKDIQKKYLKDQVIHVDFQGLREGVPVKVMVPLEYTGVALGVKLEGGILNVMAREVEVECEPSAIPNVFKVDVTRLRVGQGLQVSELPMPEGVALVGNKDETIVIVVESRATRLGVEGEESEEKAAGEGAAGQAES